MTCEVQRNANLTVALLAFEQGTSRYRRVLERTDLPVNYTAMNADLAIEIMQAARISR